MAVAYRTKVELTNASRSNPSYTRPGTIQADDIEIVMIEQDGGGSAPTAPAGAGFTALSGSPFVGPGGNRVSAWWRRVVAGDAGTSSGAFTSTADFSTIIVSYYSGAATSGDPQDAAASHVGSSTTSLVLPSITTTTDGCLIVITEGEQSVGPYPGHTGPGSERSDIDSGALYDFTKSPAGATGTQTVTVPAATSAVAFMLALKPVPPNAVPSADVTDGAWTNQAGTNVNLYQSLDEVSADDTYFIESSDSPATADTVEIKLSNITP